MRFLSVADRELRSAAHRKATYHIRWITALVFFGLLVWLFWLFNQITGRRAATEVFKVFSVLTFLYCLILGSGCTADCISAEKRGGTLGLLFLTNLNSAEIIGGKLCSTAVTSVYGLLSIFPMLAFGFMVGGITFAHFARTLLGLANGILFALAVGLLVSVLCKRQFIAIAAALGLSISVGAGLMLAAAAANSYGPTRPLANWLGPLSPLYTVLAADGTRLFGPNRFWQSAAAVTCMSLGCLGVSTLLLGLAWRDRPARRPVGFWRGSIRSSSGKRIALRRRLLAINPLLWLGARQTVSAPIFMLLAVLLTIITIYVAAPFFGRVMRMGTATTVFGHLFAWFWAGWVIHGLVLYYGAMVASQRLAEDKQAGALELILSTPTTERTISRGLWLAYGRKMLFPAVLAVLVHWFFIYICMVMATLDSPGQFAPGITPGEFFWSALLDKPLRGTVLDWQLGFMLRAGLLLLLQLIVAWVTLGWIGRWLGLRMKHPGFAPMVSLALLIVPPVFLFSLAAWLANKLDLNQLPPRRFMPVMMWLGLAIGIGHCVLLSVWASLRLRRGLRAIAMSRYQPLPTWRWRLPSWRVVRRLAYAAALLVGSVALVIVSYYGYQNWRSRRAWNNFQTALKRKGESLALSPPRPVPDDVNFARSPAFLGLLNQTNAESTNWLAKIRIPAPTFTPFGMPPMLASGGTPVLMDWYRQTNSPLRPFVSWTRPRTGTAAGMTRQDDAAAILHHLESESGALRELALAASRLPAFQTSTNLDVVAVLHSKGEQVPLLERLHLLFVVRACALLANGQNADAAEDVLTALRLARLARQLPDVRSTIRVQMMLARSLQPLWEGLSQQAWDEPQLAAFQHELEGFNLLADYTNAVRRVVFAQIQAWRTVAESTNSSMTVLSGTGGHLSGPASQLQPRAWWYDNCIQLYEAGRNAIAHVDISAGQIQQGRNWSDLSGLPLGAPAYELLQQWNTGANPESVAFAQTSVNQAIIACALHRFFLQHGVYPATLESLVPALMPTVPHDAISGRPMIYQHTGDDTFILRGVGPNGLDDRKNKFSDDWLWTYSTNKPAAIK